MRTIEIRTTQNVTIEYELAPVRERILSTFIDLLVVGGGYIGFILVLSLAFEPILQGDWLPYIFIVLMPILSYLAYHFLFEWLGGGQSLGKRALGIKVMRLDGKEPVLSDFLLRAFFLLIDGLFSAGLLGILLISSSPKSQRLGDIIASTTVIRLRSRMQFKLRDILKIESMEGYQPRYPEVQRLTEEDMLLVKTVINRSRLYRNPAHAEAVRLLSEKMAHLLDIQEVPRDQIGFLRTLLKDYIVLTR
jgi:uncharacterized RDD family membrane protein YckC